jgi:integrase
MAILTDRTIQAAKAEGKDKWITDGGARGSGRLCLRVQPSGRRIFYFRYSGPEGIRQSLALGEYSQKGGRAGLTLTEARDKAGELSRLYLNGIKDLRGHLEAEQKAKEREHRAADELEQRAREDAKRGTLRGLLNGYTDHLERAGKVDVRSVRGLFRLHVFDAFPDLADTKAREIRPTDLRQALARLIDAGKGRTAGKLRSYLRAAYSSAIRAEHDPTAPASLLDFGIEFNPCDALPALTQFTKAGDRTLTDEELRLYLVGITGYPAMTCRALELALYLGGQRPTQLLRVTPSDVELTDDGGEIRLRDGKGARKTERLHVLPLVGKAREIVVELMKINGREAFLFRNVTDTHLRTETLSETVGAIADAMVLSERSRSAFKLSDIRRTCETMLARLGISKDIRAQLLSHGLGGVQQRHYDRHEYMAEKRAALVAWEAKLEAIRTGQLAASNVHSLEVARAV